MSIAFAGDEHDEEDERCCSCTMKGIYCIEVINNPLLNCHHKICGRQKGQELSERRHNLLDVSDEDEILLVGCRFPVALEADTIHHDTG